MKSAELNAINFKDSLVVCYPEIEPYLIAELQRLRDGLAELPESASEQDLLSLFEKCILALNDLENNEELENAIETEEREGLCNALGKMGDVVGLGRQMNYIDKWRDW